MRQNTAAIPSTRKCLLKTNKNRASLIIRSKELNPAQRRLLSFHLKTFFFFVSIAYGFPLWRLRAYQVAHANLRRQKRPIFTIIPPLPPPPPHSLGYPPRVQKQILFEISRKIKVKIKKKWFTDYSGGKKSCTEIEERAFVITPNAFVPEKLKHGSLVLSHCANELWIKAGFFIPAEWKFSLWFISTFFHCQLIKHEKDNTNHHHHHPHHTHTPYTHKHTLRPHRHTPTQASIYGGLVFSVHRGGKYW